MRYVSKIIATSGQRIRAFRYTKDAPCEYRIGFSDIDVDKRDGVYFGEAIGIGPGAVVLHDALSAGLFKYVNSARTILCKTDEDSRNKDIIGYNVFDVTKNLRGCSVLELQMRDHIMTLSDTVVSWSTWSGTLETLHTLYHTLIYMCRETGVNLMSYKEVRFCTIDTRFCTIIKFSQTPQAQRFLTKMYMAACGRVEDYFE